MSASNQMVKRVQQGVAGTVGGRTGARHGLLAQVGRVAPEMQITQESSVAGYADYLDRFVGGTSIYIVGLGDMIPHPDGERHSGGQRHRAGKGGREAGVHVS